MKKSDAEKLALQSTWFAAQAPALQTMLLQRSTLSVFQRDEHVYSIGDTSGSLSMAASGSFGYEVASPHSEQRLVHIAYPGTWFGTRPLMAGLPRVMTVRVLERSHVLTISVSAIQEVAERDPSIFRSISMLTELNLAASLVALHDLLLPRSHQRVAAILLRVAGATMPDFVPRRDTIRATQQDFAEMANVSRDGVNRVLNKFQQDGAILVSHSRIDILNAEKLVAYIRKNKL